MGECYYTAEYKGFAIDVEHHDEPVNMHDVMGYCATQIAVPYWAKNGTAQKTELPDQVKEVITSVLLASDAECGSKHGYNKYVNRMNKWLGTLDNPYEKREDYEKLIEDTFWEVFSNPEEVYNNSIWDTAVQGNGWIEVYKWACEQKGYLCKILEVDTCDGKYFIVPTVINKESVGFNDNRQARKFYKEAEECFSNLMSGDCYDVCVFNEVISGMLFNYSEDIMDDFFLEARERIDQLLSVKTGEISIDNLQGLVVYTDSKGEASAIADSMVMEGNDIPLVSQIKSRDSSR